MWARLLFGMALGASLVVVTACGDAEDPPPGKVADPDASTIPEVCRTLGNRSACQPTEHLEPRSQSAQEDCQRGVAERRCGEARFLLERCLDLQPLCYGPDGVPTNDIAGRCLRERTRWQVCVGATPP